MPMTGGRVHNTCGTQVEEAEVDLDLRAEFTIAGINLERLEILENLLDAQRRKFEEYRNRLTTAAGGQLEPYPISEESLEELPIAGSDAFGLLVSRFFHQPEQRFPQQDDQGRAPAPNDQGRPSGPDVPDQD